MSLGGACLDLGEFIQDHLGLVSEVRCEKNMITQNDKHQYHERGQLLTRNFEPLFISSSFWFVIIGFLYSLWQS